MELPLTTQKLFGINLWKINIPEKNMSTKDNLNLLIGIYSNDALYFRMPKVASETITAVVQENCVIIPHSFQPAITRLLIMSSRAKFKFSFTRHPYDRFYSAYKWATRKINEDFYKQDIKQQTAINKYTDIENFSLDLERFTKNHSKTFPVHFYPQSLFVYNKGTPLLDFAGKYENLEVDFNIVSKKINSKSLVKFGINRKNSNKNITPVDMKNILNIKTRSALDDFYHDDFINFNYNKY